MRFALISDVHFGPEASHQGKLRKLSQQEHLKVAAVANGIVLEAVRRARARRSDGN
jgi:hypothetical protein